MAIQRYLRDATKKCCKLLPCSRSFVKASVYSALRKQPKIVNSYQNGLGLSKFSTICPEAQMSVKFDDISIEPPVLHDDLMNALHKCKSISEQMEILAATLALPPHDLQNRFKFCKSLELFFKPFFVDFKIQIFGSSVNCFGFKGCDMDMTFETSVEPKDVFYLEPDIPLVSEVLLGKVPVQHISDLPMKDQLVFMHNILLEYYKESKEPPIFINAHVPLVRFKYDKYNLKCDLTFKNTVAYANTKLMYLFAKLDRRIVPLMMTLRYWAKHSEIIGKGLMFNTYTISLLVIYFLQSRDQPILPSAEYIMSLSDSFESDMEDRSFLDILEKIPPTKNTQTPGELLRDFFSFYLLFDFTRVICPLTASAVPREEFFTESRSRKFKMNTICVQDPMSLTHNVADLVDFKTCKKLSSELLWASEVFRNPDALSPSPGPWGLMAIFDKSLLNPLPKPIKRNVSFRIPFTDSVRDREISFREKASTTADAVLRTLQHGLLLDCKVVTTPTALDWLKNQDIYVKKRKQEMESQASLKREIHIYRRKLESSGLQPEEPVVDHAPPVSVVEEFERATSENDLLLCAVCKASKITWVGRKSVCFESTATDAVQDFLARERRVSEYVSKQVLRNSTETIKSFTFLCEFYASRNPMDSEVFVMLRPLQRLHFNPLLSIFLKDYLYTVTKHL